MSSSHDSLLSDQNFLVALNRLGSNVPQRRVARPVGSGTGAVVCRTPLGCVRRFRLRARLGVPSLRLRPPPHRTGQADFPHPAHREGVFHRGYASVQLGHAFALQYTTR
jgi:hypothetical protein